LTVDAQFDGENLATDPVELSSTPDINQELAWEVDRKTFQYHKLQRSVIKCRVYSTQSVKTNDSLGYFLLPIRSLNDTQVCTVLVVQQYVMHLRMVICWHIRRKFNGVHYCKLNIRNFGLKSVFVHM
jgi:hypothetical protein